jgi:deoxyadenosine/deoxycytidine kinase
MQRWSFNLQIYFLNSRFRRIIDIRKSGKTVIQDRTIYEDAFIFAPNLHGMNLMSTRDFENYKSLFELISSFIQPPDLLIYLRASVPTLVSQIQKRGREYESAIRIDYLKNLNDMYEEWVENYKLGKILFIDVDNLKFSENSEHLGIVIEKVNAELHGLF